MNAESTYTRVLSVAEKFGRVDHQAFRQLAADLAAAPPQEVLAGLLLVFARSHAQQSNYVKQELAGRLLAKLKLNAELDLVATLRSVLPGYNASIEQLPQYLAARKGRELVIDALKALQTELGESRASASAKTMRWWLKDSSLEP
jgi:hypothetical protein